MSFFSSVFLCYENSKDYDLNQRHSFKCKEFNNYLEADYFFRNRLCNNNNSNSNAEENLGLHTMVCVPKLLPPFIKNSILHYKISKNFVNTKISKGYF